MGVGVPATPKAAGSTGEESSALCGCKPPSLLVVCLETVSRPQVPHRLCSPSVGICHLSVTRVTH